MSTEKAPINVKLSEWEKKALERQVKIINKTLAQEELKTITCSKLVHKILEQTITKANVDEYGNIII